LENTEKYIVANPLSGPLPSDLTAAPMWALIYVGRMASVCQYSRPLRVVTAPDVWFDSINPGIGGCYFCAQNGDDDLIAIRESAQPTDDWYDVLAHEFAHALHGEIDRYISERLGDDAKHTELVERFVPLLGGLVQAVLGRQEAAPNE
jgi:hypothetical protein